MKKFLFLWLILSVPLAAGAARAGGDTPGAGATLEAIRGGRHPGYVRFVLDFAGPFAFEAPQTGEREVLLRLPRTATRLGPQRSYRSLGSWVRLEAAGPDLEVRVGLPQNFRDLSHFVYRNPDRLVLDLFVGEPAAAAPAGLEPPKAAGVAEAPPSATPRTESPRQPRRSCRPRRPLRRRPNQRRPERRAPSASTSSTPTSGSCSRPWP